MRKILVPLVLATLGWLALPQAAQAQQYSCDVAPVPEFNFGRPGANPTAAVGTTTNVTVACTGKGNSGGTRLKVCIGISAPILEPRAMRNELLGFAGTALLYDIRRDSYSGAVIGPNQSDAVGYLTLDTAVGPGNSSYAGSTTITLYGVVRAGQSGLPAGTYIDPLIFGEVRTTDNPDLDCASADREASFWTTARARVDGRCTVAAEPLPFGRHFELVGNVTANASLGLTCTDGTVYTVRLDGGNTGNPQARQMRLGGTGPQAIDYELYQDPGHTRVWGNLPATSVGGIGDGTPTTLTVYGLVPAGQPTPNAGTYTDMVTVTVEY